MTTTSAGEDAARSGPAARQDAEHPSDGPVSIPTRVQAAVVESSPPIETVGNGPRLGLDVIEYTRQDKLTAQMLMRICDEAPTWTEQFDKGADGLVVGVLDAATVAARLIAEAQNEVRSLRAENERHIRNWKQECATGDRLVAERDDLRARLATAEQGTKADHIAWGYWEDKAKAAERQLAAVRDGRTLAWMQRTQPWTAPYSLAFEASKQGCHPRDDQQLTGYRSEPHRSLMHDLMHVTKAVGILASIAEWADHGDVRTERVDQAEYEGRVADLVMCALHMANNPPEGYAEFELQRAVIERVERVNNVKWASSEGGAE